MKWTKMSFCMFITVAVIFFMVAGLLLIVEHSQPTSKTVLAYRGDTVLVDTETLSGTQNGLPMNVSTLVTTTIPLASTWYHMMR